MGKNRLEQKSKDNKIVEKDHSFNCPGVNVGMCRGTELDTKLNRFQKTKMRYGKMLDRRSQKGDNYEIL
jgi:hypothetical protein